VDLDYDPSGLGGSPIGNIGNTAFFGRGGIASASLDGRMRSVVPTNLEPSGLVCIAGRRLMLLSYDNGNGPWTRIPGSSGSLAAPGGVFLSACGHDGPVMASQTTLYRFVDGAWLSEPMKNTPTAARSYAPIVTPSGDLVYSDSTNVYRLHRGNWTTKPLASPPTVTFNPGSPMPFVVVGDIAVAALYNHKTGVSSLRVVR
jgi:hypothetical protein